MTQNHDNDPRPTWAWQADQAVQKLRSDHEAAYREFKTYQQNNDRRIDTVEQDYRTLVPLPTKVEALTSSIDKLSDQLEEMVRSGASSTRSDWTFALQILGFGVMTLLSASALLVSILHSGVHP